MTDVNFCRKLFRIHAFHTPEKLPSFRDLGKDKENAFYGRLRGMREN
jgi:hypothetical protein